MTERSGDSAMVAEFDTMAHWTVRAVEELGPEYAVPAACRGSGSPADLAWLADGLDLGADDRFLDVGAGLGGPAAWLTAHVTLHRRPVLMDPMTHAVDASRRLFGFTGLVAECEHLPLPDDAVDAAWSLGVLCTTPDSGAQLAEVHRVLAPGGRLAVLVLVAEEDPLPEAPEGNHFPTRAQLHDELGERFAITAEIDAAALPAADEQWQRRAQRVTEVITRDHGDEVAWRQSEEQQQVMGRLMREGRVSTLLLAARAR